MQGKYYSLIEMGFTLVVAFGFGFWQLYSVSRSIADDEKNKDDSGSSGHPVGEHPLDDG